MTCPSKEDVTDFVLVPVILTAAFAALAVLLLL